jgi:hypothetical protein
MLNKALAGKILRRGETGRLMIFFLSLRERHLFQDDATPEREGAWPCVG